MHSTHDDRQNQTHQDWFQVSVMLFWSVKRSGIFLSGDLKKASLQTKDRRSYIQLLVALTSNVISWHLMKGYVCHRNVWKIKNKYSTGRISKKCVSWKNNLQITFKCRPPEGCWMGNSTPIITDILVTSQPGFQMQTRWPSQETDAAAL